MVNLIELLRRSPGILLSAACILATPGFARPLSTQTDATQSDAATSQAASEDLVSADQAEAAADKFESEPHERTRPQMLLLM